MKTILILQIILLNLALIAADPHSHEHNIKAGPSGGKVISEFTPHLEFYVTKDNYIELRSLDQSLQAISPQDQVITVILGDRSAPTQLTFTKDKDKWVSNQPIPKGERLPTVIQYQTNPEAKKITKKFNLDLSLCTDCKHLEYACACPHQH
jgi:hypothetical protein